MQFLRGSFDLNEDDEHNSDDDDDDAFVSFYYLQMDIYLYLFFELLCSEIQWNISYKTVLNHVKSKIMIKLMIFFFVVRCTHWRVNNSAFRF